MPPLIVEHVAKQYDTRAEPVKVLHDVSLELSLGESLAIVGPSGCGKSTLLQILGTLDRPTSGTVKFQNENPFVLSDDDLARFRSRNIGFVFQEHHLLPQLSVLENVLVPLLADGQPTTASLERAQQLLARVGLAERLEHRPAELSGGERARVAVARALIRKPLLLLADEPTGALDRTTGGVIGKLLVEMQQQEHAMLIVVTHNADLAELMQRQFELDAGKLTERPATANPTPRL